MRLFALLCVLAPAAWAHVPLLGIDGKPAHRADFRNVHFAVNSDLKAGAKNNSGQVMVTGVSDPLAAARAAISAWAAVTGTSLRFAPLEITSGGPASQDGVNVIAMVDTAEARSVVGSALAVTLNLQTSTGILESDIYFSPDVVTSGVRYPFSTTGDPATYDFGSTLTHELGHALGANHSGFVGATMHYSGTPGQIVRRTLSSDDIAFVRQTYPADGASAYGTLKGAVFLGGKGVRRALVSAVDPDQGISVGGLTSATGEYSIGGMPPGSYLVYAEPLDGPVVPGNLYLFDADADVNFKPAFAGGNLEPARIGVSAGETATTNIDVQSGATDVNIDIIGGALVHGPGSYGRVAVQFAGNSSYDLILIGAGLDTNILEQDILLLGPGITIRSGSIRVNPLLVVNGFPALYVSVDVAGRSRRAIASIVVRRGEEIATFSGGIVLLPSSNTAEVPAAGIVNAASVAAGNLAPDSWVSLYGSGLAGALLISEENPLPLQIGGTRLLVTDSAGNERAATLQFVAPGQINFIMPAGTAPGPVRLRLVHEQDESSVLLQAAYIAPGLFTANSDGRGAAAAVVLRVHPDGSRTNEFTFSSTEPAGQRHTVPINLGPDGEQIYISLYGTGIRGFQSGITAKVGGLPVPVLGAAAQGVFAGLDQINIGPLPRELAGRGDVDVEVTVDGVPANTVRINVQ